MRNLFLAAVFLFAGAALAQGDAQPPAAQGAQAEKERQATQPGNNAPVWRDVRKEGQEHFTPSISFRHLSNASLAPAYLWIVYIAA